MGVPSRVSIAIRATSPRQSGGLQAVDHFLWALQRLYEQDEDRYWETIRSRVKVVYDRDNTRTASYGVHYTPEKPVTREARAKKIASGYRVSPAPHCFACSFASGRASAVSLSRASRTLLSICSTPRGSKKFLRSSSKSLSTPFNLPLHGRIVRDQLGLFLGDALGKLRDRRQTLHFLEHRGGLVHPVRFVALQAGVDPAGWHGRKAVNRLPLALPVRWAG